MLFHFEGVYQDARVKVNGHEAGGCAYGYLPFYVDAAPYLTQGDNVITVECDNVLQPGSRWYSGAGIYRPVWLYTGGSNPILPESIRIRTLSYETPRIEVSCPRPLTVDICDGEALHASGYGETVELELPGAATYDDLEYLRVALMKAAGFNAIRSSHNPASRALVEACDALGMYLIDEAWDMWCHAKTEYDYAGQRLASSSSPSPSQTRTATSNPTKTKP